ncbi:hypothetical protein V2665_08600 [Tenacibaculum maritimum]|uniref:hypothetical protein n=1 Tax=Tenacibaculum maritimum TaxID=107401 RepID=UPI001330B4F7|nr:hypothetical protein [Tenacibaculum maritimum]
MKNVLYILALLAIISFTSCTDINDEEISLLKGIQAIEKDKTDPRYNSDPEDE